MTHKENVEPFHLSTAAAAHLDFTLDHYQKFKGYDRGSVISGLGDAVHMCDAIAADIEREHTVRGTITKEGRVLAAVCRRAGDAIWAIRNKIP